MNYFIITLFFFALYKANSFDIYYDYKVNGPDVWFKDFEMCGGQSQSPINIKEDQAEYDSDLKIIEFNNFNRSFNWKFKKNRYDISFVPGNEGEDSPSINNDYKLEDVHLHWGYNCYQGSEHTINGKKFPLEMQMFHRNSNYKIMALSYLFKISSNMTYNPLLKELLDAISLVNKENEIEANFNLQNILPNYTQDYYRYSGSYTTPPCYDAVDWIVFYEPIEISMDQMDVFHELSFNNQNFRGTQKINGRQIRTTINNNKTNKGFWDWVKNWFVSFFS